MLQILCQRSQILLISNFTDVHCTDLSMDFLLCRKLIFVYHGKTKIQKSVHQLKMHVLHWYYCHNVTWNDYSKDMNTK